MYTVVVKLDFTASHQLTLGDGTQEPLHEHRWHVEAAVEAEQLDKLGLVMDFHKLETHLRNIVDKLSGSQLEQTGYFGDRNSSAETVAKYVYDLLGPKIPAGRRLCWVQVTEAPGCKARYSEG